MASYSKQAKKTGSKTKKVAVVAEISDKVAKATAIVATNYQGMTHVQLEKLKKALKPSEAELVVTKNTLLKRALHQTMGTTGTKSTTSITSDENDTRDTRATLDTLSFEGPTATLFAYGDPILALKEIAKSIKALQLPKIKFGIFENKVLADTDVIRLSSLPTKEILLTQLVGGLKSPIYGLHRALQWNLTKFVMTLSAIQQKKI